MPDKKPTTWVRIAPNSGNVGSHGNSLTLEASREGETHKRVIIDLEGSILPWFMAALAEAGQARIKSLSDDIEEIRKAGQIE